MASDLELMIDDIIKLVKKRSGKEPSSPCLLSMPKSICSFMSLGELKAISALLLASSAYKLVSIAINLR